LHAKDATIVGSRWILSPDPSAADGRALINPNLNEPKVPVALASPGSYVEFNFTAAANTNYHIWLRMKAQSNDYTNDSLYVQLDNQIGTTNSLSFVLEEGSGAGVANWGWNDDGYGVLGMNIKFTTSGTHTIRLQQREDGISVDQIVLSPITYLSTSPGLFKNDTTILPAR
jgi:hypothetical protein